MNTRWLVKDAPDTELVEQLKKDYGLDDVVAYMLAQRKITTKDKINQFFNADLDDLHSPLLMTAMKQAVNRVNKAINDGEKVLIYGDYDVDGTTAVALVYGYLSNYIKNIDFYIPDRYTEGYGVSEKGIKYAKENNFSLIITLDCGIKANSKVELANKLGIDMIICDHHTPGKQLPECIVLDPKRSDCNYPDKGLSGCGVGFKLMQALTEQNNWEKKELFSHLDLLAISIGADIVPVTGENRILAQAGLKLINQNNRVGIKKMLQQAKKEIPLTLTDIVFTIAPRINAAGRLKEAHIAVQLLICKEEEEALSLAKELQSLNEERRKLDKEVTEEALAIIENDPSYKNRVSTVVYHSSWHKGVVGIVASRLIEKHYFPTIVLTQEENGVWTGSARSIKGVNIYSVLQACEKFLIKFGGHFHAAGLSLKEENLMPFIKKFDEEVRKVIDDETLIPEQIIEKELLFNTIFTTGESTQEIPRLLRVLDRFEPYGPENMKPLFLAKNIYANSPRLLKNLHLKMQLNQPDFGRFINAIYFNAPEAEKIVSEGPFDVVFTIEKNAWKGRESLQLMIKDIRKSIG